MALDFKRILCPVDLSPFSLEALKLAVKIAENAGAGLYFLHVIDNPFDELYMKSITEADPALLELYQNEPMKRAKVMKATVEHSEDRKSTRLNSSHRCISYAVFCLKKKNR